MLKKIITFGIILFSGCSLSLSKKEDLSYLQKMVEEKPMDPQGHYKLAELYCRLDSTSRAIEEYKILIKLEAEEADDYWLRVKIASFLGLDPFPIKSLEISGRSASFSSDSRYLIYEASLKKVLFYFYL